MRLTKIYILVLFFSGIILYNACQRPDYSGNLPEKIDFNFHIRPILSENCFLCHGPDPSSREANLRLDIDSSAMAILENGRRPIHPYNWQDSEVIRRVTSQDSDLQMPPPEMNKRLSPREIALLKRWMEKGAEWKKYWAFIPPQKPIYDVFYTQENTTHKIDFLLDKTLEDKGLDVAGKAEKTALIRRLSYLLTGLPPNPADVLAFSQDERENAYEKLVDRLLAAPQFGERWARHWMDLVRYAEYKGHEFDYPVLGAWQYRDYLIRAFNEDVPYNQLVKEHLAGDLLKNPRINQKDGTNESIHGTQFFTFGEGKHSPVSIKQEEADYIDNMIDVTTKTFQGLTVACARCHDHKFDAIPTTDYYALYGIFESTRFALIPSNTSLANLAMVDSINAISQQMKEIIVGELKEKTFNSFYSDTVKKEQLQSGKNKNSSHQKVLINSIVPQKTEMIADFRDGTLNGWTADGLAFNNQNALGIPIFDEKGQFLKLEDAKASSRILSTGLQGALRSPTFTINKEKLLIRAAGEEAMIRVIVDNFQLIQDPIYGSLETRVSEGQMKDYVLDLSMVQGRKAYVELLPAKKINKNGKGHYFTFEPDAWIESEYAFLFEGNQPSAAPKPKNFIGKSEQVAIANWLSGNENPNEIALLNRRKIKSVGTREKTSLLSLFKQKEQITKSLYDSTFFQGVLEGDAQLSRVFERGSINNLSEEVPHRYFTALKDYSVDFPLEGSGRMALAESMINPRNPLTARVMVNRIWYHLFGKGIVETVDNFGLQGKIPSHPELLDFLAIQFVEDEWSIKKLIKHIVLTEAFQRSTFATDEVREKDPENIYLAYFPVRRLEGEAIRDGLLAVSGRLDKELYGKPYEIYLTDFIKGRGRPRHSGELDGNGRRSIYQAIRRNFLPPFMLTFDMPAPFSTFGKRNISNVPAQSLTMMNDPFIQQQAGVWAEKVMKKSTDFDSKIQNIYLAAFARKPNSEELGSAKLFFKEQGAVYKLSNGDEYTDIRLWTDYCHSIFMMKEFIFLAN